MFACNIPLLVTVKKFEFHGSSNTPSLDKISMILTTRAYTHIYLRRRILVIKLTHNLKNVHIVHYNFIVGPKIMFSLTAHWNKNHEHMELVKIKHD